MDICYNRIKQIREEKNISQGLLAEKVGISRRFLCDIESGKSSPSVYTAIRLSDCLQVALEQAFIVQTDKKKILKKEKKIKNIIIFCLFYFS